MTAKTSSHSPSMVVNIASVRFGRPESRTTRTAAATASWTDASAFSPPLGATENATSMVTSLLLLSLVRDRGGAGCGRLRVEVARRCGRAELVVELVDERDSGRDVELGDL